MLFQRKLVLRTLAEQDEGRRDKGIREIFLCDPNRCISPSYFWMLGIKPLGTLRNSFQCPASQKSLTDLSPLVALFLLLLSKILLVLLQLVSLYIHVCTYVWALWGWSLIFYDFPKREEDEEKEERQIDERRERETEKKYTKENSEMEYKTTFSGIFSTVLQE
ncbi:hypothetical protein KQX54_007298 [Cotesia glomerata]|uniref:Uncharacterized protein n=1 Tax=Cotesia glomerata TaxID=32391 RepID=A0AAV7I3B8_COTGL|nr:hypothetical protein KQX54_007298 [Cotesia glomerata]